MLQKSEWYFCSYTSPFYQPIEYSPTDKVVIDRSITVAYKTLTPHVLILQMLLSRFQASRYQKPSVMLLILRLILRTALAHKQLRYGLSKQCELSITHPCSTHPLAREARFSFLLFGFEVLKSCRMDSFCEHTMRDALYSTAFSWFAEMPRYTFGANRVQIQADFKLMTEFLSLLQTETVRGFYTLSSLSPLAPNSKHQGSRIIAYGLQNFELFSDYVSHLKSLNQLLRLLVENELFRLSVWQNVMNDVKQSTDHVGALEKTLFDVRYHLLTYEITELLPPIFRMRGLESYVLLGKSIRLSLFICTAGLSHQSWKGK